MSELVFESKGMIKVDGAGQGEGGGGVFGLCKGGGGGGVVTLTVVPS
jgi:hypothetical protein